MKEKIKNLLAANKDGLSVKMIEKGLDSEYSIAAIRQCLKEMEDDKIIVAFAGETSQKGRPENIYKLMPEKNVFKLVEKKDEDPRGEERKLLLELISETTDRHSTMPIEKLKELYGEAAICLMKENPIKLFTRFGVWLHEQHKEQAKFYLEARERHQNQTAEKHKDIMERLENLASFIFNRLLGVPAKLRDDSGWKDGPFCIKFDFDSKKNKSHIDPQELEKYLTVSIFGKTVIEEITIDKIKTPFNIGGSDASIQSVDLSEVVPWKVESREIQIVTAVGTRYNILDSVRSEVDWYPEPRVLAEYERVKAIKEGFIIPPTALGFEIEMERRIREAAMNLRQYHKDHEIMFEKEPLVKVHFRDGRIFPVEHRFSDSIQSGLHGEMVRSALNMFKNILNQIGVSDGNTLFCGFVKRPGLDWLAPLTKWYMGFGSRVDESESIDPKMTLDDFLKYPSMDTYVSAHMFNALRGKLNSDKIFVTCRILRRFHTMQEPRISSRPATIDVSIWKNALKKNASDESPTIDEAGLDTYAALCARAAVMSFYTSLGSDYDPAYEISSSIPKIELMVPFQDLEDFPKKEKFEKNEANYVKRTLDTLLHKGVLTQYQDQLYFGRRSPKIFLVPKTVRDAHDASKSIAKVYKDDFMDLLLREAKIFWLQYKYIVGK